MNVYPQHNGIAVYFRVITEQKRIERELREALQKYRVLFDSFPLGITIADSSGHIIEANEASQELLGLSVEAQQTRHIDGAEWRTIRPDGTPMPPDEYASVRALSDGRLAVNEEAGIVKPGGAVTWIHVTAAPLADDRVVIAYQDITARKSAEEAAAAEHNMMRSLLEYTPDAIYFKDREHRFVRVSRTMVKGQGLEPSDLIGRTDFDNFPIAQAEQLYRDDTAVLETGKPIVGKVEKLTLPDGSEHWFSVSKMPRYDQAGQIVGTMGISRDVTDLRQLQEELRHQERLAAVGRLASGIAHDFNNLLATIVLYGQLALNRRAELPPDVGKALDTILSEADHGAALVRQILDFSRSAMLQIQPLDLTELAQQVLNVLRPMLPRTIRPRLDTACTLKGACTLEGACTSCGVMADAARLQQVLINLALNARDAMPNGGELHIAVCRLDLVPAMVPPVDGMAPGPWARLQVTDTGTGMSEEAQVHLFEPFFTTKGPGEGRGLGLSQVYGIVKQHDGYIDVRTELGVGTSVAIYLPAIEHRVKDAESTSGPDDQLGHGELLLLVEDQEALRSALEQFLTSSGYRVMAVADGPEALDLALHEAPDLLITDIVLPGMSGIELLPAIRELYPETKAVAVTGYALDVRLDSLLSAGFDAAVAKPFDIDQLLLTIRTVLT